MDTPMGVGVVGGLLCRNVGVERDNDRRNYFRNSSGADGWQTDGFSHSAGAFPCDDLVRWIVLSWLHLGGMGSAASGMARQNRWYRSDAQSAGPDVDLVEISGIRGIIFRRLATSL